MNMTKREIIRLLKANTATRFKDLPPEAQVWARLHVLDMESRSPWGTVFTPKGTDFFNPDCFHRLRANYPEPDEFHCGVKSEPVKPDRAALIEAGKENEQAWIYLNRDNPKLAAVMESVPKMELVLQWEDGTWHRSTAYVLYPGNIYRIHRDYAETAPAPARPAPPEIPGFEAVEIHEDTSGWRHYETKGCWRGLGTAADYGSCGFAVWDGEKWRQFHLPYAFQESGSDLLWSSCRPGDTFLCAEYVYLPEGGAA
jgi:hypothetical protein